MKKVLFISTFLIFIQTLFAQTQFQMRFGSSYFDVAKKVIQTQDGNYIIAGQTNGFGSAGNCFIMKVNPTGAILWLKDYAGINIDKIFDIIELPNKSLAMCGSTSSYGAGYSDGFVMKTDSIGNIVFAKSYGSIHSEYFLKISTVSSNAINATNEYYVAGLAQNSVNTEGTVIIKMDSIGNILWSKWSSNWNAIGLQIGGEGWYPISMTPIASGGVLVLGNISGTNGFDIFKYTSAGSLVWSKRYSPGTLTFGMFGYSILENSVGQIIINYADGNANTVAQSLDIGLIKLDSAGNFILNKSYGGTYTDYCNTISNTSDGGIIICGYTNSAGNGDYDVCLIKLNQNDSVQWAKAYGTPWTECASNVVQTFDGGYILTGQTWSTGTNIDSSKVYLVKVDSLGNSSCNDISWTPIVFNQPLNSGNPVNPVNFTFQVNPITWNVNNRQFYSVDLCNPTTINLNNPIRDTWSIFPNPFTTQTILSFSEEQKNTVIKITDILGNEIKTITFSGRELTIERGDMCNRIYFVQITDERKNVINKKIIVQ